MTKRQRTDCDEESNATYRPRTGDAVEETDISGAARICSTKEGNGPAEGVVKKQRKSKERSDEDESISKPLRKQGRHQDEVHGPQKCLVNSLKRSKLELRNVTDNFDSDYSKKKKTKVGGNNSAEGICNSALARDKEQTDALDGRFNHSLRKWVGEYKEDETNIDRDQNESSEEFRSVAKGDVKPRKNEAEYMYSMNFGTDEKSNADDFEVRLGGREGEYDMDSTLDLKSVHEEDCTISLKRRRSKPKEDDVDMSSVDGFWATSLRGPHLDLMVSLKQLAEQRLRSTGELSLSSCLTPAALRTIGIILEEVIKDRVANCQSLSQSRAGNKQ